MARVAFGMTDNGSVVGLRFDGPDQFAFIWTDGMVDVLDGLALLNNWTSAHSPGAAGHSQPTVTIEPRDANRRPAPVVPVVPTATVPRRLSAPLETGSNPHIPAPGSGLE